MRTSTRIVVASLLCSAGLVGAAPSWGQVMGTYGAPYAGSTGMIAAGHAPMDKALSTLIPEPYRIELDARVPRDWVVSWPAGDNWMQVLSSALAPMGLTVDPDWGNSTIRIRFAPSKPASADPATASSADRVLPLQERQTDSAVPTLTGADGKEWMQRAPYPPKEPIRLDSAVLRLLPPDWQKAAVAIQGVDTSERVRWPAGVSRYDAMLSVLRAVGAVARIEPDTVRIFPRAALERAPTAPVPAESYSRVALVTAPAGRPIPLPAAASAPAPAQGLHLVAGQPVGRQMKEQGAAQGWQVVWNIDHDWLAPADTTLSGTFDQAVRQAVEAMAAEGAPIRATVYTANHTIVISQNGENHK